MITRLRYFDETIGQRLAAIGRIHYDDLADSAGDAVYSTRWAETHRIELPPAGGQDGPHAVYVKVYRPGQRGWKYLLRPGKAWFEARNLQHMARLGVPVVRPVAVGSARTWRGLSSAMLITEEWTGGVGLDVYARQHWPIRGAGPVPFGNFQDAASGPISDREAQTQREIAALLADAVRLMHRHWFYHLDLQWRNVLIRRGAEGRWELALLDFPRATRCWTLPGRMHARIRDLASLDKLGVVYLTCNERLLWLRDYLGKDALDPTCRRLIHKVVGRVMSAHAERLYDEAISAAWGKAFDVEMAEA